MKKKDIIFTIGLTIFMGVLWVAGMVVMGLWLESTSAMRTGWFVGIVVVTLIISVWHSMKEDESDKEPPMTKYEKKMAKREEQKKRKNAKKK